MIVGTVDAGGEPFATRGWGLTVLAGEPARIRLLLDPDETQALTNMQTTARVAVTATSVVTANSLQLKGRLDVVEPALEADVERAGRYCDEFFGDIVHTDRTPGEIVERLRPEKYIVCIIEVEEIYDQTPGPSAGTSLVTGRS